MRKALLTSYILLITFRLSAFQVADSKLIEQYLNSKYSGHLLTLRNFYTGDRLRYTADGKLKGPQETGTWTLYSTVEIKKISLNADGLQIDGSRRAFLYDAKKKSFVQARTDVQVHIDVDIFPGGADKGQLEETMTKLFITPKENLLDFVPPLWQSFLQQNNLQKDQKIDQKCSPPPGVFGLGKDVKYDSYPKLLSRVDPANTEVARYAKVQGTVHLCIVVQHDGSVGHLELLQPLGMGLDEAAAEAVKMWRFQPAMKDGIPVEILATIEVTFRLK